MQRGGDELAYEAVTPQMYSGKSEASIGISLNETLRPRKLRIKQTKIVAACSDTVTKTLAVRPEA